MEKRTLLAIILSFLVLYVYQNFFMPTPQPVGPVTETDSSSSPASVTATPPTTSGNSADPRRQDGLTAAGSDALPNSDLAAGVGSDSNKLELLSLPVEGALWRYDPRAGIVGWHLSEYQTDLDTEALVDFAGLEEREPAFRFWAGRPSTDGSYQPISSGLRSSIGTVPVRLQQTEPFRFAASISGDGNQTIHFIVNKHYPPVNGMSASYLKAGLIFIEKGEVKRKDLAELTETGFKINSSIDWIGIEDKYFILLFDVRDVQLDIEIKAVETDEGKGHRLQAVLHLLPSVRTDVASGDRMVAVHGYLGPKDTRILAHLDGKLTHLIDFGMFSVVARPMLAVLHLFNSWIGNWGLAIILLTIVIKTLLFPLQIRFTESMYRMQSMKPKIEQLKGKFKDDKARMNQEMAALYKQEGVNPLGGCLPMFLQLPIFIALYNVLYTAIELRQAPFYSWIADLSQAESLFTIEVGSFSLPFRLLPLLMAVTSYIQTKLTPTSVDNEQQKMMMTWMPVIFTFLFYSMPSGLMLYWLTQNLLTIVQNLLIKRRMAAHGLIPG